MELVRALGSSLGTGLGIGLLFLSPLLLVGWWLNARRKKYRAASLEPFTEMPLRPPGESLRKKLEELNEQFDEKFAVAFMLCIGAATFAGAVVAFGKAEPLLLGFSALVAILAAAFAAKSLSRIQRQLWDYRLGFDGERAVGETLNRLIADGFEIFHDMPFEGFNIDHIIVGPPGVFAVETKTRRKPAELKGTSKATVIYDGAVLTFPRGYVNTNWIEQAQFNAKKLSEFLSSAIGEPTTVKPILTLPGWFVERRGRGSVNVLNPKEIQRSFRTDGPFLPPDRIQRIVHQLTERCRIEKAK